MKTLSKWLDNCCKTRFSNTFAMTGRILIGLQLSFRFLKQTTQTGAILASFMTALNLLLVLSYIYFLLEFTGFGYFCIPTINKDLNKKMWFAEISVLEISFGRNVIWKTVCLFRELSFWGTALWETVHQETVHWGNVFRNCQSGKSPSEKSLSGKCPLRNCPRTRWKDERTDKWSDWSYFIEPFQ